MFWLDDIALPKRALFIIHTGIQRFSVLVCLFFSSAVWCVCVLGCGPQNNHQNWHPRLTALALASSQWPKHHASCVSPPHTPSLTNISIVFRFCLWKLHIKMWRYTILHLVVQFHIVCCGASRWTYTSIWVAHGRLDTWQRNEPATITKTVPKHGYLKSKQANMGSFTICSTAIPLAVASVDVCICCCFANA